MHQEWEGPPNKNWGPGRKELEHIWAATRRIPSCFRIPYCTALRCACLSYTVSLIIIYFQLSTRPDFISFAIVFLLLFFKTIYQKSDSEAVRNTLFFQNKVFLSKNTFESAFISGRGQFCYCYEIPLRSSKMGTLKPVKIRRASRAETPGFLRVFADSCQNGYP